MMTRNLPMPMIGPKFAAAILFLLPVALVCAQNTPPGGTASPEKSPQALPVVAPVQAAPAIAAAAGAGSSQSSGESAAAKEPNRAQAYYHLALAAVYEDDAISEGHSDEVNQAIEQYKLALNADPGSAELSDDLADLYFRVGRVHDAEATARALLKNSPGDIEAHRLLGRIYLRQLGEGQKGGASASSSGNVLDQAIAEFEKIVALDPKSVEDHMVLGQLYTVKHLPEKAEAEFKTAEAIEPEAEDVVLNLARLYAESGDIQHAVKAIEAVPQDGRTPKMEFMLGALYDQLKQPKDAIAAYRRADDLEPGDLQTMDALAAALLTGEQLDEALKQYKALAEADPENSEALVHIGEIERRQGKYEEALATIRKARKIDPKSLEAGFNEGLLLDVLGRFDDAVQTYQEMVDATSHANGAYTEEEKNNRGIFLERLGAVCLEENKTGQAIAAYQKMIDLGGSLAVRGYQGQVDAYRGAREFDKGLRSKRPRPEADARGRTR
jgi:tetratricopeptide (TPR) repeat protein